MILSALSVLTLVSMSQQPVTLSRTYKKGETAEYKVHSTLNSEQRQAGLETWLPEDYDLIYNFTYNVTEMKQDGIAMMHYLRPTITEILGETVDKPPQTRVEKINMDYKLQVSPLNELIKAEENKPKPKTPERKPGGQLNMRFATKYAVENPEMQEFFAQFIQEIYRLALFSGNLETALDFAPGLPIDEVLPGDTWKKTAGYSPQKLAGGKGQFAVQRLDYTYTYKGLITVNNKPYHRIEGKLKLNTDLVEYIHATFGVTSKETNLKNAPLTLDASIQFDLDPKTCRTVRASGATTGGFSLSVNGVQVPVEELRFKSKTDLIAVKFKSP